jgi:hypothetical protein
VPTETTVDRPTLAAETATDPRPDRSWLLTVCAALVAIVVFAAVRHTLIDDAYITLDYARNLAFHWHWGLIQTATANTATSALNVLILAFWTLITRSPVLALGIVYVLATAALEYGLRRAARTVGLPAWIGLLAVGIVSVNPLLLSSIGLEVALGAGLIGLLVAAAAAARPVWFGVLAGLLVLTRPDLLIVVAVVFALRPGWYRGWWRSLLAGIAVILPWYVWSWLALGSALPDTLILKTGQHPWGGFRFGNGPQLYRAVYPDATWLSFLPAVLGAFAAVCWLVLRVVRPGERVRRLDRFAALPLAGGLHYLAYTMLGVPPYHWYYGTTLICFSAYLAAVAGALWAPAGSSVVARVPGFGTAVAGVVLLVLSVADYTGTGLPRTQAQITTNWASPGQYAEIGAAVGRLAGDRTVQSAGEIGAIAYYCDCSMVDAFSDRGIVVGLIPGVLRRSGKVKRKLISVNFHFLNHAQRPIKPELELIYTVHSRPKALGTWRVSSPWMDRHGGSHYLSLIPVAAGKRP